MQLGFYFNQTRCTGCFACIVACKDWHDVPPGPASWMRVKTVEEGRYPDLHVSFLVQTCYHCAEPGCVKACPVHAIRKRDDGIIVVDRETCLGNSSCNLCLEVCPYDAPQFGAEDNAKMQMCDLCLERLENGMKPICVAGCPMRALDAGPIDELAKRYGEVTAADGFVFSAELKPSILFKPSFSHKSVSGVVA